MDARTNGKGRNRRVVAPARTKNTVTSFPQNSQMEYVGAEGKRDEMEPRRNDEETGGVRLRSGGKLNSLGVYLPFEGTTVVMVVKTESLDWSRIEAYIKSQRKMQEYFAPLPASSYHITLCGVTTRSAQKLNLQEWYSYLVQQRAANEKLATHVAADSTFPVDAPRFVSMSSRLSFVFSWDAKTKAKLDCVCNTFGLRMSSPHMSLAYEKRPVPKDDVGLAQEFKGLEALFLEMLRASSSSSSVSWLNAPQFCYFPDMTRFIPWTGNVEELVKHGVLQNGH